MTFFCFCRTVRFIPAHKAGTTTRKVPLLTATLRTPSRKDPPLGEEAAGESVKPGLDAVNVVWRGRPAGGVTSTLSPPQISPFSWLCPSLAPNPSASPRSAGSRSRAASLRLARWSKMAGSEAPAPLLLWMLALASGSLAGPVVVDQKVSAILGKNFTLKCIVTVKEDVTQISWEKQEHGTADTVAVFHPKYGISIQGNYSGRAEFTNPSSKDATILMTKVGFSDSGNYICKVVTFPLGNYQETSTVTVIVEPTITVGGGPEPLVDGANATVAAVCTAANGKPEAIVSWESDLDGKQELTKISAPNGTVTVINRFKIIPSRFVRKRPITCIVSHPPLNTAIRVPYVLDVQ